MDLTLQKLREMFAGAASDISANEQYLCSLDSVCGDGDHGVAIRGAICAASDALKSASNLKDALYDAGMAAMANSNGSTSTIYGTLLMGLSDGIEDGAESVPAAGVAAIFSLLKKLMDMRKTPALPQAPRCGGGVSRRTGRRPSA